MPAPVLAAPLVIPFAEAVGISIATLGMAKAADMVNDYIQENPEQSIKILSTIVPGVGIGEIFMKKGKDEEEVEVEDVDARDLTRAEKAKEMKRRFKEGTGDKREIGKKGYEEIIQPGESDRELDDAEDRYDGGLEEVKKTKGYDFRDYIPRGAYKKRYADGGAIGIEVLFGEKNPRQGLFMGGSPLTGQALSIYNSMNAYGFDDQAIADALAAQGLYTPGSSTPVVEEPVTNIAPNIINQGGGGDGPASGPTFNRNDLLGTPDYFPAEPFSFKDTVSDIGDYIKGGGIIGAGIRGLKGLFSRNTKNYVTTPQIKARDRVEAERIAREEAARQEAIRQEAYAQARQDRETYRDLEASITSGQGGQGFDRPSSGPTATGAGMGVGGGYASDYGFKNGGLAAMFKEKR